MTDTLPRISAIMPTRNRRVFLAQAITYFLAQDYPCKELIIIDDGECSAEEVIPDDERIRYVRISAVLPIGMKRNVACSLAKGAFICHFDDDDYYGPQRLSKQIAPLLAGEADFSAMRMSRLLDMTTGDLWTCDDDTHRRLFKQDVHYGTLLYPASSWHSGISFPPVQVGEDVRFVHALLARGARLARIVDPASFAYVLHGKNTTTDMRIAHPDGWHQVALDSALPPDALRFYASQFPSTKKVKTSE